MSQNPHFDLRNRHSKADVDKTQQPRPPKPETEAHLLAHGKPAAPNPYSLPPAAAAVSQAKRFSSLSVNAPEFKPKVYQYQDGSSSVAQMPPPPFLPPGPGVEAPLISSFDQMSLNPGADQTDKTNLLLDEFSNTMFILTTHPANVRDFLKPLCDKLQVAQSPNLLEEVINILYEQGIYVPNFRYTGARVVHFLSHELKNHSIFGQFKSQFLKRCQIDYNQREELMKSGDDGVTRLCGLTMFMGELFLNVSADAQGQTERLTFLPNVLTDLLLSLLTQPTDNSIKTVCQLLKLAGGPTEDVMAQTSAQMQKFNHVFSSLHALQSLPHISQTSQLLVKSVLNLRQNNWGRVDSRPTNPGEGAQENTHVPPKDFSQPDPVFYTMEGKPISRAEAGYQEEEDEEDYDGYELTEEEEQDFLIWQEEASGNRDPMGMAPPVHLDSSNGLPPYAEGAVYQQWSTADADYGYPSYSQGYDYNAYPYIEDEGLNDEMEKAYEEFLSSQRGPSSGRR